MFSILVFIAVYIFKPALILLTILSTSIAILFIGQQMKNQYIPANSKPAESKPSQSTQEISHA